MENNLKDLTKKQLWQLFPVVLSAPSDKWKEDFIGEEALLKKELKDNVKRISHIGSTAISGIFSKSVVDILVEAHLNADMSIIKDKIINCGYICMAESSKRISFNKGYTLKGYLDKVFHLHLVYFGDNDELYFRDYLFDNPSVAKQYEKLKICLAEKYKYDRDEYTSQKAAFVTKYTDIAKKIYEKKYI